MEVQESTQRAILRKRLSGIQLSNAAVCTGIHSGREGMIRSRSPILLKSPALALPASLSRLCGTSPLRGPAVLRFLTPCTTTQCSLLCSGASPSFQLSVLVRVLVGALRRRPDWSTIGRGGNRSGGCSSGNEYVQVAGRRNSRDGCEKMMIGYGRDSDISRQNGVFRVLLGDGFFE